jgi:hypothetical protein
MYSKNTDSIVEVGRCVIIATPEIDNKCYDVDMTDVQAANIARTVGISQERIYSSLTKGLAMRTLSARCFYDLRLLRVDKKNTLSLLELDSANQLSSKVCYNGCSVGPSLHPLGQTPVYVMKAP